MCCPVACICFRAKRQRRVPEWENAFAEGGVRLLTDRSVRFAANGSAPSIASRMKFLQAVRDGGSTSYGFGQPVASKKEDVEDSPLQEGEDPCITKLEAVE